MKDFKSYQKNTQNQGMPPSGGEKTEPVLEGEAAELAKKALAAYNGKSESYVLLEILRQAEAGKRAGTLTNADIDAFYKQFSPMLNDMQRKKFKQVVEQLKKI